MQAIYQRMQKDFCLLIAHDKTAISNRNFVVEDVFCLVGPPPPEKLTGDISSSGALRPISPSCRSWCGDRGSSDVPALHHVAPTRNRKAPLVVRGFRRERPAPLLVRRHAVKNRPRVGVSLINSTGRCHSLPVVPVVVGVVVGAVVGAVGRPSSAICADAAPAEPSSIAATTAAVILPVILISVLCFEKLIAKLTYGGRRL